MTCFPARKDVPVEGVVDNAVHLGGQKILPKNFQFGDVNRHILAKVAKYYNLHIVEATASIPTKFCIQILFVSGPET